MFQRIFNSILVLIFLILVALYAYKTLHKPQIISQKLTEKSADNTEPNSEWALDQDKNKSKEECTKNPILSESEIKELVKDYIMSHPEDIVDSLEEMQKKKSQESQEKVEDYLKKNQKDIEATDYPPILGNPNGNISIVAFYDYNCSFCKKANKYTNEIISLDQEVKLILRPMPILGGTSMFAAKVALAIQKIAPEKFLDIHNTMMEMKLINKNTVKKLLEKHNIDYNLLDNEINSFYIKQLINNNFEFAKNLNIQGAPSYVINGNFIPGLISVQKFKTIISEIRQNSE